jgi:hypothetical protein
MPKITKGEAQEIRSLLKYYGHYPKKVSDDEILDYLQQNASIEEEFVDKGNKLFNKIKDRTES